jgi:hypothetical protein
MQGGGFRGPRARLLRASNPACLRVSPERRLFRAEAHRARALALAGTRMHRSSIECWVQHLAPGTARLVGVWCTRRAAAALEAAGSVCTITACRAADMEQDLGPYALRPVLSAYVCGGVQVTCGIRTKSCSVHTWLAGSMERSTRGPLWQHGAFL